MVGYSDVDVKPEVDVGGSSTATNPPIPECDLAHDYRDVVARDAKRLQIFDDLPIQSALCVYRASSKGVDADSRVAIGLSRAGGTGKSVRLVSQKPDMSVARRNPERTSQCSVDGVHERYLFSLRVLSACLD